MRALIGLMSARLHHGKVTMVSIVGNGNGNGYGNGYGDGDGYGYNGKW